MPRGEGEIFRAGDKKLHLREDVAGADAACQRLEKDIAEDGIEEQCRRQHPARPPRPAEGQQQSGQRQPDKTGVAQMGEKAHDFVQRRCAQGLQSVQESEFGVHEVSSFSFRSVYRIPEVCEQKSTKS